MTNQTEAHAKESIMPETAPPPQPDTSPIHDLLCRTRRWLRSSWAATGTGVTIGLFVGALVAVTLIDLAIPLWPIFRLTALLVVVVPAALALVAGVFWPLVRRLTPGQMAQRIEAHIPKMHNRLISCIDLDSTERQQRQSVVFYRRLIHEVRERLKGFKPTAVIDRQRLRRAGVYAGSAALAFLLTFALFSDRMPTAMARVFAPFADIPPASGVIYSVEPGDAKVLRGEEIPFVALVEKGEPEQLRLELIPDNGKETLWYDLQKQDPDRWVLNLTGLESSFTYRVHGGGTWTREHRITLLDRPTITSLHTVLHFPKYMDLPEPRVGPPQVAEVTGPQSSTVEVVTAVDGDVATGAIEILEPRATRIKLAERPLRQWFADKPPAGARSEGTWPADLTARKRQPPTQGLHGHGFLGAPAGFPVQKGETLYAYVAIPTDKKPDTIMLQWRAGTSQEHRAVWGADKIPVGTPDTPSYRRMGPIPAAGDMVRLEVPAALVNLEGKTLNGMNLALFNGQATLRGGGTLGSAEAERVEYAVVRTLPMHASGDHQWFGAFPLEQDGFYRVALRNELGHPNKAMKEARCVAIADQPPMVVVERPGADLTIGEPSKVPLVITAFDDFGLAELTLHMQRGEGTPFTLTPIRRYPRPLRNDTVLTTIDLPALNLKPGDSVRYHVEARDRKGQTTATKDYVIRLSMDKSGADKELTQFEKNQDPFQKNLEKLIAQQAKVREQVEKVAAKYQPVTEKVNEAKARQDADAKPDGTPPKPDQMPQLDPDTAKKLEELRKELAEMAQQEQQNTQLSEQMAENLKQLADQANKLQMLPPQLAHEMQNLQQLFQNRAVQPLKNLTGQMNQGADAKKTPPDLKQLQSDTNRLQKELEAMRDRMQALARAENQLRANMEQALAQLQRETQQQNSALTARELEELQKAIDALRKELVRLESQQAQQMQDGQRPLGEQEKRQTILDQQEEKQLAATRQLQGSDPMRRARRNPQFPDMPYTPENGEKLERPREQDGPDAAKATSERKNNGDNRARQETKDGDEPESMFMPALGGPKPKVDPRYANRQRPMNPQHGTERDAAPDRQAALRDHQAERMEQLSQAQQSLGSDAQTLEGLLAQLQEAMRNSGQQQQGQQGQPQQGSQPANQPAQAAPQPGQQGQEMDQQLAQMLHSPAVQQAMQMAARLRQMRGQQGQQPGQQQAAQHGANPNMQGAAAAGALEADFAKLDPATRSVILKMQPKLREELLQGMREAGPEGYQKFIDDYFKRLTEVKKQ